MNEAQKSTMHERILIQIDKIRDTHMACTAESVARDLKMPVQNVKLMCGELREAGLVDWTPMPGSLRTVKPLGEVLAEAKAELDDAVETKIDEAAVVAAANPLTTHEASPVQPDASSESDSDGESASPQSRAAAPKAKAKRAPKKRAAAAKS